MFSSIKRQQVAAVIAEFVGTLALVLITLVVTAAVGGQIPLFTEATAAITVIVFYIVFASVSGGHFNPIVSVGMFAIRKVSILKMLAFIVAQLLAAVAGSKIYEYVREQQVVLGTGQALTEQALEQIALKNSTIGTFNTAIVLVTFIGAAFFGFAVAAVAQQRLTGYKAAYAVGGGLFIALVIAGLMTTVNQAEQLFQNTANNINPAVAIASKSFDSHNFWGAVLGFTLASVITAFIIWPDKKPTTKKVAPAPVVAAKPEKTESVAKTAPAKKTTSAKKPTSKKAKKTAAKKKNPAPKKATARVKK